MCATVTVRWQSGDVALCETIGELYQQLGVTLPVDPSYRTLVGGAAHIAPPDAAFDRLQNDCLCPLDLPRLGWESGWRHEQSEDGDFVFTEVASV